MTQHERRLSAQSALPGLTLGGLSVKGLNYEKYERADLKNRRNDACISDHQVSRFLRSDFAEEIWAKVSLVARREGSGPYKRDVVRETKRPVIGVIKQARG